ncbi:hypothetical protein BGLA2_1570009 [Burkholderia gladioli]|nr:hypothetical protein BGLA2_1570009 [Burkholderia gladioli]
MKLSEGVQWLACEIAGFAELEAFEACCRDAAGSAGREAAALLLIARVVAAFAERQDGVAVQAATMHAFLTRLHAEAQQLNEASERALGRGPVRRPEPLRRQSLACRFLSQLSIKIDNPPFPQECHAGQIRHPEHRRMHRPRPARGRPGHDRDAGRTRHAGPARRPHRRHRVRLHRAVGHQRDRQPVGLAAVLLPRGHLHPRAGRHDLLGLRVQRVLAGVQRRGDRLRAEGQRPERAARRRAGATHRRRLSARAAGFRRARLRALAGDALDFRAHRDPGADRARLLRGGRARPRVERPARHPAAGDRRRL